MMVREVYRQWVRLCEQVFQYSEQCAGLLEGELGWLNSVPIGTSFRLSKIAEIASERGTLETLQRLRRAVEGNESAVGDRAAGGGEGLSQCEPSGDQFKNELGGVRVGLQKLAGAVEEADLSLDRSAVQFHVLQVFFPKVYHSCLQALQIDLSAEESDLGSLETLLAEFSDNGELSFEHNSEYIQGIIRNYTSLYDLADDAEHQAVLISILKELSFDPKLQDEFEANYENSIIRSIMNNESEGSNNSSDDETKILDFNETLTFHVDVISDIIQLIHSILSSTSSKLKCYQPRDFDMDISNLTAYRHNLKIFESNNRDFKAYLIGSGTAGLCDIHNTSLIMRHLNGFEKLIKTFIILHQQSILHFLRSFEQKKILFKEEDHFNQTLNLYLNELMIFNKLMDSSTVTQLTGTKRTLFGSSDSALKDKYFELLIFRERVEHELRISEILINR